MIEEKNIGQIAELWKEDKKQYVKKSTFSAYMLIVANHILPHFGHMGKVVEEDVQKFVFKKLEHGLNSKTIKDILIVLKMILKFGVKNKWLEYEQIDIRFPTEHDRVDLKVLSRSDHKKVVNYIKENFTFKNLGIYICLSAGVRIGELCALCWNDIDTDSGVIRVRKTIQRIYIVDGDKKYTELIIDKPKTQNSMRDIPISSDLQKRIKPIKKVMNGNYFILTNDAKPTEPRTYRNYYNRLIKQLGLPKLKFHGLRHSFATRCIEGKCDYKTVSVILGHSNISTTLNLYVHPNLEQKKKCIEQMHKTLK